MRVPRLRGCLFFLVFAAGPLGADEAVYVPLGSNWKYLRGLSEASYPDPTAWRNLDFDDASWATGQAPFGFGANEGPLGTDLATLTPPMRGGYTTLFLRRRFQVPRLGDVVRLEARVVYDDGFALWINGVEVARDNAPATLAFDAAAPRSIEARDPVPFDLADPLSYLREGENVVAVQAFNQSISNSDFKIDLALVDPLGPDITPPEVDSVIPPRNTTVRRADRVEVLFTEEVAGVDAMDLLLAGKPATRVQGSGRGPYVFFFPPPRPGDVEARWAPDHGIADLATRPNAFRGGSWSYRLDPSAALPAIVVSEFCAINRASARPIVRDENGEYSDWIEIHNAGTSAADLAGWSLTDDPEEPGKWTFPARALDPGAYLLVFASGKDRRPASGNLHTNFQLASDGEYLGLYVPESPRVAAAEFSPRYPPQRVGVSWGLGADGSFGYFAPPTPGQPNGAAAPLAGFVAEPRFSPGRGIYKEPLDVEIYSPTPGARIYYTTDGSEPDEAAGSEYSGPVRVAGSAARAVVVLRAVAVKERYLSSRSVTHTYIFPEHVLRQPAAPPGFPAQWGNAVVTAADYAMDQRVVNENPGEALRGLLTIPSLSVAMDVDDLFGTTRGIYSNANLEGLAWERPASAELIYPDGRKGFQVNCGIRIQGGSSTTPWKAYKLSLRLLFKGDYGPSKLVYPLFPDSAVGRFDSIVLDAHLNLTWIHPDEMQRTRSQYVRDAFASDLQNAMGSLAPHGIFAHLYLDGLYWGLYEIHERPDASFAAEYLGGEKEEYDVFRHEYSLLVDGERTAWNQLFTQARAGLATTEKYLAIMDYLDVADLADYMLVHIYCGNDDWPRHNWYAARRRIRGAGFRFFSWDSEHILKDLAVNQTVANLAGSPAELYTLLRQNADWRLLFADRAHRHFFFGPLYVDPASPQWDEEHPERNAPAALYMKRIREIDPAIRLESARWGDNRRPTQPYTRDREWMAELNWLLKTYFPRRSAVVLDQLRAAGLYPRVGAPILSRPGGLVNPGVSISLQLPSGTTGAIYYTLDGTDPRLFGSGFVSTRARLYAGPITISDTSRIKARTLSGDTWSALAEALYVVARPIESLAITEVMYHPEGSGEEEFIELHNAGAYTVDLSGLWFEDGIRYAFPEGSSLAPGEYLVLVANPAAFSARYPGVPIAGVYEGRLANGGEKVTLRDSAGKAILSVDYGDEGFWPVASDGFGRSLVALDPFGDLDDPTNWRASAAVGGSPGAPDAEPSDGGVAVSEVLARAEPPYEQAIELQNLWDCAVDVGGWYLSDSREDAGSLRKFRIPDGTVIEPGDFAVFYEREFRASGAPGSFALDPAGGAVYLSAADRAGNLTGYISGLEYRGAPLGVSFGRVERSVGPESVALEHPTFGVDDPKTLAEFRTGKGAPNAEPLVGPVVINEIHYHPAVGEEEFVELHNRTDSPVAVGGWTLRGVLDALEVGPYAIPTRTAIPARGFLLVVGVDPAVFRARYKIAASVPIVGPYGGALENAGETLRLERPYDGPGGAGAMILVDRVRYDDRAPWPLEADGRGRSLERLRADDHGNDPLNWAASLELGGSPGRANGASGASNQRPIPRFDVSPQASPLLILFDASRSRDPDGTIRAFEWTFGDGTRGTGQTVLHEYRAPGSYTVRLKVKDDAGAESGAARVVTVRGAVLGGLQLPGDGTQDGFLNLTDAIAFLGHLFLGSSIPYGCAPGPISEGPNLALLDSNGDGRLNITDPVYLLNYLFLGGPPHALGEDCVRIPGCQEACGR